MKTIAGYVVLSMALLSAAVAQANAQVTINFDNLPCNTYVTNQYPQVTFSSVGINTPITHCVSYGTSLPNLTRGSFQGLNHFAELILNFTRPVRDLTFHTLASDSVGVIANIDVYRNGSFSQTLNLFGSGFPYNPIFTDLRPFGNDITRIRIYNITDLNGLAFDNFQFTPFYVDIFNPRVGTLPNGSTQNALLGADVNLQATVPTSISGGSYSWSIAGPYELVGSVLHASALTVRWRQPGTYAATVTYTKDGVTTSSTVNVNVIVPTLTSYTATQGSDLVRPASACPDLPIPFIAYRLGCPPPRNGMEFTATAQVQSSSPFLSNPTQSGIKYTQIISAFRKRLNRQGNVQCNTRRSAESDVASGWQLDVIDPYGGRVRRFSEGSILTMETNDYPAQALSNPLPENTADAMSVDDRFEMYVVYFTGSDPSSPIFQRPLGRLIWNWGGQVVFDSTDLSFPVPYRIQFSRANPTSHTGQQTTSMTPYQGNVLDLPWALCPGGPPPITNQIDSTRFFVRWLYKDFLDRDEPDQGGWDFWSSQITRCAFDTNCINSQRVAVARAFFDEAEFVRLDPDMANPPGTPGFDPSVYNPAFVRHCYRGFLLRTPNSGGFEFWVDVLNRTGDYNGVINGLITGTEYRDVRLRY